MHYWSSDKLCLTQSASFFSIDFSNQKRTNQFLPHFSIKVLSEPRWKSFIANWKLSPLGEIWLKNWRNTLDRIWEIHPSISIRGCLIAVCEIQSSWASSLFLRHKNRQGTETVTQPGVEKRPRASRVVLEFKSFFKVLPFKVPFTCLPFFN